MPIHPRMHDAWCRRVRFDAFELDLRSGELRKRPTRLTVPDQSNEVLAELLETPGELVMREPLRARLRVRPCDSPVPWESTERAHSKTRDPPDGRATVPRTHLPGCMVRWYMSEQHDRCGSFPAGPCQSSHPCRGGSAVGLRTFCDRALRFFPIERDAQLGWWLHLFDAATNKP
jgi:hypothetical protein